MARVIKELSYNGSSAVNLTFPFISTMGMGSIQTMIFSNAATTLNVLYSIDGINTDLTESTSVGAGGTESVLLPVKSPFMSLSITVAGQPQSDYQVFFFNVAAAEPVEVTLGSAGGVSLVNDGVGPALLNKGITAGTAISFVDSGSSITINAATTASTVWGETSAQIKPITASTVLITGDTATNVVTAGFTRMQCLGGNTNITTLKGQDCAILGGQDHSMLGSTFSSFFGRNCIIGGINCTIQAIGYSGGDDCNNCLIAGSTGCTVTESLQCSIIGSSSCQIGPTGDGNNTCTIIGSSNCTIPGTSARGAIISGFSSTINPGKNDTICMGNYLTSNHTGSFLVGDNTSTNMTSSNINRYHARFVNGYNLYSNAAQTTGMTMAAGASSWAAVCDVNKKENIIECDYTDVLAKVKQLPIHCYNYKTCCPEERNISPMAQDWHALFPLPQVTYEEETGEVDEEDEKVTITKIRDAKDKLVIEQQDMIGVLYACVKELTRRIEVLESVVDIMQD